MGTETDRPRYLPPEPLPRGGTAGAARAGGRRAPVPDLAEPPRPVPPTVRVAALFGGFFNQFGWLFFGFGMIFVWAFVPGIDFTSWYRFRGDVATTQGTVTAVRKTHMSENNVEVYEIRYAFAADDGRRYEGTSYTTGARYGEGQTVDVEYCKDDPGVSRIAGARRRPAPIWVSFVLVFPLVGLVFIVAGLKRGMKANRLLGRGKVGLGTLKSKEPTNTSINDQPVYKLTFEFAAEDGQTYEVVAKTHETHLLEDDAEERLLYDPWNPRYAAMLDNLPGAPEIDETGRLHPRSVARGLAVLILPLLTLLGHGLYVYYGLLR